MTELSLFATTLRTHQCGALRLEHVGRRVRLGGWVHRSRDLGGLLFIDLRDREGLVQLSFGDPWSSAEVIASAAACGVESVVLVEGEVVARGGAQRNPELATGDVDVRCASFTVVGPAVTPAIPVALGKGEKLPAEELRLRHRVLDLRRAELQQNLMLRHRLLQAARRYFSEQGFPIFLGCVQPEASSNQSRLDGDSDFVLRSGRGTIRGSLEYSHRHRAAVHWRPAD